jgi:hypothetical protein
MIFNQRKEREKESSGLDAVDAAATAAVTRGPGGPGTRQLPIADPWAGSLVAA